MNTSYRRFLALLCLLCLLLPAAAPAQVTPFTDDAGRQVVLPSALSRIAPTGPLAQLTLLSLVPERFVGLTSALSPVEALYLAAAPDLPVIGQLYGTRGDLNLEELARLDPQLIIDVGESKPTLGEDMNALQDKLGIPTVHIGMKLEDSAGAYRRLGALLGVPEKAEALAQYLERAYARAQDIAHKVADRRVRVLYCLGEEGLSVLAKGSFHAQVLDMVAENAAQVDNPSAKGTGNEVDMEQLYLWDPDFIIFAPGSVYDKVGTDPLWQGLKAIAGGRYVEAPQGPYNWMGFPAGVQRYLGMMWLQKTLYPGAADYDLQAEVTLYYELFYGYALRDADYAALMQKAAPRAQ